jgi:branched-chain amino acid transport system substrate-binding protein
MSLVVASALAMTSALAQARAAEGPIKVGWVGPLSGVLASYGLENKRGVEFAVKQINAAGGLKGRPLEVIYVDSKFDPGFAVQAIQRMALEDKVVAILGDISSALTVAMVPVTARFGIPQLASLATTPKITEMNSKFIFRPYPSANLTYSAIADYATNKLKYRRYATIGYNDEGGIASINAFKKAVEKDGKSQVVSTEIVPVDMKDFKGVLGKIRDTKPDALVLAAAAPVSALISKQVRELGWDVPLLGHGGYQAVQEYRDIAGSAGDGMVLAATYAPGLYKHAAAKAFIADWGKANNGAAPRDLEAHGFDQIKMLAWAIENGRPERAAIRDRLSTLKNWEGAAGIYSFLPSGDVVKSLVIEEWKDGKLLPIEVYEKTK